MSALFQCETCGTQLIDQVRRDRESLSQAFLMSAMAGDGDLALNILRPDATCPICGESQNFTPGPPPPQFKKLPLPERTNPAMAHQLLTYMQAEVRGYIGRIRASGQRHPTPSYLLAHVALRYFAFGTLTHSRNIDGLASLLNPQDASQIFQTLSATVENGDEKPPLRIEGLKIRPRGIIASIFGKKSVPSAFGICSDTMVVHPFEITDASCFIIQFPPPATVPDAHFAAILLGSRNEAGAAPLRYFTLEQGEPQGGFARTYLGEWQRDGGRHNFGPGPCANVDDLVECLDRVYTAGIGR